MTQDTKTIGQLEVPINRFLRTYRDVFSERQFSKLLSKFGLKVSREECMDYLRSSSCAFQLDENLFITRAGAFSDKWFSIKPTRAEVERKAFAAGGRCIPFVDSEMPSYSIKFRFNGRKLPKAVAEFDSGRAVDMFAQYGVEFASQYIAADPANSSIDLAAQDFTLPPKVSLTCASLGPIIRNGGFKFGDRLLCRVTDWDSGVVEVTPLRRSENPMRMQGDDFDRQAWYDALESALLRGFDVDGPCMSIDEQLALAFANHSKDLCSPACGSVEEFLSQSKKIAYRPYGVETRLWRAGEDVPAVGKWNNMDAAIAYEDMADNFAENFSVPDFALDAYIMNQFFHKKSDISEALMKLLPERLELTEDERERFLLRAVQRRDKIEKTYNWFADYSVGALRSRALALFSEVHSLVFAIDGSRADLDRYPQQELVILSQMFGHVIKIIEMIQREPAQAAESADEVALSLEGMESNFDDIREALERVVESEGAAPTGFDGGA